MDDYVHLGIKFVMVLGDLTQNGRISQLETAKNILESFHSIGLFYVPLRGNHDVEQNQTNYTSVFKPVYEDLSEKLYGWQKAEVPVPGTEYYMEDFYFEFEDKRFLCLDFSSDDYRAKVLMHSGGNYNWLMKHVTHAKKMKSLIFAHHPFTW